jgi:hypothetical protein
MFRGNSFRVSTKTSALNEDALRNGMRGEQKSSRNKSPLQTAMRSKQKIALNQGPPSQEQERLLRYDSHALW